MFNLLIDQAVFDYFMIIMDRNVIFIWNHTSIASYLPISQ